jgi:hypothetical protein
MEAIPSSETSGYTVSTRQQIPEDGVLQERYLVLRQKFIIIIIIISSSSIIIIIIIIMAVQPFVGHMPLFHSLDLIHSR